MATTTNKGYELQSTGSNSGTWGSVLNTDVFTIVDNNLGGTVTKTLSSSPVTISATEAQNGILRLIGSLSADVTVTTPLIGFFYIENATSGNYIVTVQYTGAVGGVVKPAQGMTIPVISDGTNGLRYGSSGLPPGSIIDYAGSGTQWTGEYLLCDGSAVSRTTYSALFASIGTTWGSGNGSTTFNIPDLRGRVRAGRDDMGGSAAGRLTTAGGGVDGVTLAATGGAQNVTLVAANLPANIPNSASSSTTTTLSGQSNVYTSAGGFSVVGSGALFLGQGSSITASSSTTTTVTINSSGGTSATKVVQPTAVVNCLIKL